MICYHGTTAANAAAIRREGFRPDSWFAFRREDALGVGGPVVLAVEFPDNVRQVVEAGAFPQDLPVWQFHVLDAISPDRIVA